MSFSSRVKEELSRQLSPARHCRITRAIFSTACHASRARARPEGPSAGRFYHSLFLPFPPVNSPFRQKPVTFRERRGKAARALTGRRFHASIFG